MAVSQGPLKASQWERDVRKANRWLRNWGNNILLLMMRTSKNSTKTSNSWLKIHEKELVFTQLWESLQLHVVEVKNRKGFIKH